MFDQLRRAARLFAQHLFPATGVHRQRPPLASPLSPLPGSSAGTDLRPRRALASSSLRALGALRADDHPLVRPYVLSAEEWARRRTEVRRPRAVVPLP